MVQISWRRKKCTVSNKRQRICFLSRIQLPSYKILMFLLVKKHLKRAKSEPKSRFKMSTKSEINFKDIYQTPNLMSLNSSKQLQMLSMNEKIKCCSKKLWGWKNKSKRQGKRLKWLINSLSKTQKCWKKSTFLRWLKKIESLKKIWIRKWMI